MTRRFVGMILLGVPLVSLFGTLLWLRGALAVLIICVAVGMALSIVKGISILVDEGVL